MSGFKFSYEASDRNLLLSDSHGIYIPKVFVETVNYNGWGINEEDAKILLDGPDNEHYWDVWDDVLRNASFTDENGDNWYLMQDGDLWAINEDYEAEEDV